MRRRPLVPFIVAFTLGGCVARTPEGSSSSSSTGTGSTGAEGSSGVTTTATTTATTAASTSTTTASSATTDATDTAATGSSDSAADAGTMGFINPVDTSGTGGPQPNGAECFVPDDCESGFCRDAPGPGGGVCSECEMDADCGMGTCSFDFATGYAICTAGELGDGCDSDRGCAGPLVCARLFGDSGPHRCSECSDTTACTEPQLCAPVFEGNAFSGYRGCVDPGTVELGGGCPVVDDGMGNLVGDGTACLSGFCGLASVMMGNAAVGICSDCVVDGDCPDGQSCSAPQLSMMGITPGSCG